MNIQIETNQAEIKSLMDHDYNPITFIDAEISEKCFIDILKQAGSQIGNMRVVDIAKEVLR